MKQQLDYIDVETTDSPTATVIWLHGLGADGHDFEDIVPMLGLPKDLGVRFIFPNAPIRPVTLNGGMQMRAWFDIISLSENLEINKEDLADSHQSIHQLILSEIERGIDPENIVLAGFSQGGSLALYCGLSFDQSLGGILALSTFLPDPEQLTFPINGNNINTPIFMTHGILDPLIPIEFGKHTCQMLIDQGCNVVWREYPMYHSVCNDEIDDIGHWLTEVLT